MGSMAIHHLALVAASLLTVAGAPETVFAPVGKSITLVMNPQCDVADADYAMWVFNHQDIVTYYPGYPRKRQLQVLSSYKSRVEFNTRDLSMELKNLMKNDTGLYTGEIKIPDGLETLIKYNLHVLEPVEKPVLTTHLNWSSGDECQVMVMCRAGDLSVTSSCNISTCTQDGDSTHGGLSIFTRHGSIICNHSNPVSWRQDAVDIRDLCPPEQEAESDDDPQTIISIIIGSALCVIMIMIAIVIGVLLHSVHSNKQADHSLQEKVKEKAGQLLSGNHTPGSVSPKTPPSVVRGQTPMQRESLLSSGSVGKHTNLHSPNSFGVDIPLTPPSEGQTPMQHETSSSSVKKNLLKSFEETDDHTEP